MTNVGPERRLALVEYIAHLSVQDWAGVARDLVNLGFTPEGGPSVPGGSQSISGAQAMSQGHAVAVVLALLPSARATSRAAGWSFVGLQSRRQRSQYVVLGKPSGGA